MLSIVKREDLTHEILINNNEISELRTLKLPEDWWHTTVSYDLNKAKPILKFIKFDSTKKGRTNTPLFPKIDYWDVKNGDYRVKESQIKSYKLNPEYKKAITFAHFSFIIVLTVATVVYILSQIAQV